MDWNILFSHEMDYPPALPDKQQGGRLSGDEQSRDRISDEAAKKPEVPDQTDPRVVARLLPGGGGVYLLTDDQDRLIQLSAAADLRRALRARLFEPPAEDETVSAVARRRAKLGEIVRKIRWQPAHSLFEIDWIYLRIARQVMPKEYRRNLAFGPAWFIHVDPDAAIPRFLVVKVLGQGGVNLGPLPTQPDAHRFVEMLEDAFDLCRCYDSLAQTPRGTTCAYYEMGKCTAPCAGLIPMEQYRDIVRDALSFASGDREPAFARWREQMQALAGEWAFEKAAVIKQRIERAGIVDQPAFRLLRPIEQFNYLVVQRGRGRTSVKPFLVCGGWITPGEQVSLKQVEQAVSGWISALRSGSGERDIYEGEDRSYRSEQIWLVSHWLFKREAPGLFIHVSELDNPDMIVGRIQERFGKTSSQPESEAK